MPVGLATLSDHYVSIGPSLRGGEPARCLEIMHARGQSKLRCAGQSSRSAAVARHVETAASGTERDIERALNRLKAAS